MPKSYLTGKPAATFGKPAATFGKPAATFGKPATTFGKPATTFGKPAATLRKRKGKRGTRKSVTSTSSESTSAIKKIVPTFLHMLNTVKIYHWQTTSFSTHKATDELYGSLNDKLDNFVEVLLGTTARGQVLNVPMVKLTHYANNAAFKKQIESYKTFLLGFSATFDPLINTDLLAIRDEILADLNKFLYLLSLED
jgi:DNA-binding ferritin-like protein